MAKKTNKDLQKEIDELIIERNNLIDRVDELEEEIADLNQNNEYLATVQLDYEKEIKELKELVDEKTVEINRHNSGWRKSICGDQRIKIIELEKELAKEKFKNGGSIYLSGQASKDLVDTLSKELQSQIILKNTYKKENKRLKKRRREGRYNPKKVYEKLARGRLCYIPEGDYLPTKVHESLIDAMEEGQRLKSKTGNTVYIVGTYCKI